MSRLPKFSDAVKPTDDKREVAEQDDLRCCEINCPLRADMFTDGRGRCVYHYLAQGQAKDAEDVSQRIRKYASIIKTVERYSRLPMKLVDGVTRGIRREPMGNGKWAYVMATYPEKLPIGDDESHGAWLDRARGVLIKSIVSDANVSKYAM